jgi:hypothetical protein
MSTVASRPRPLPLRRQMRVFGLAFAALATLAVALILRSVVESPARVERIEITNPHQWMAIVHVTDAPRSQELGLGAVDRAKSQSFEQVIDQGDTWIFRFSYSGVEVEQAVPRAQLERDRWKVTVPDEFATRLEAEGVPPTRG